MRTYQIQNREIAELLKTYPANVQDVAMKARQMIIDTVPDLLEMVDRRARVIGYGFGASYKDLICTIILSKSGAKLGIVGARIFRIRRAYWRERESAIVMWL